MSNTQPEQRPDRNGKVVTRHVKSGAPTATKKAPSVPAPKVAAHPTPQSKYGSAVELRTSAQGNLYYVEDAPANPNQSFRDPLFNITTNEGISFEIQQDSENGTFYRGPERYGKSLDTLVDWF